MNKLLRGRNLYKALFFTILASNTNVKAQNYPEQVSLSSVNYNTYQAPSGNLPGYLEPFTETMSGSTITRISDKVEFGTNNYNLRHNYAKDQTWNADESLIKLAGYPAAILDGETFDFLYWSDIPGKARWANTEPDFMYGTLGNRFVKFDVTSNTSETLETFSSFSSVDFGFGEGNQSNDDKYVGLIGENGNNTTLIVYNIQEDRIISTKDLGTTGGSLDWFSVSQSGDFAVLSYKVPGPGTLEGVKTYDIYFNNESHISDYASHGDLGYDIAGNEVFVAYHGPDGWDAGYSLYSARLDGGGVTNLYNYPGGIWGGHISCRNIDRPGWAYVSEQCCTSHPVAPREIFAIKLDGSGTIERYTKHHNNVAPGYMHSAMAVPNRNGTKILFASNWENSEILQDPAPPAWVLKFPQTQLSVDDNTIDTNALTVYPNPVNNIVNIKVSGQNNTISALQLHDILGRILVDDIVENQNTLTLDVSTYPKGVYLLSVNINGVKQTKKIIKE